MTDAISPDGLDALIAPGWTLEDDGTAIARAFTFKALTFKTFIAAFGVMTQSAIRAETLRHHPEWVNILNKVKMRLTTHNTGGLSENDARPASRMDKLAGEAA